MSNNNQDIGFIWVDFTFRKPEMSFLFTETGIGIKKLFNTIADNRNIVLRVGFYKKSIIFNYRLKTVEPATFEIFSASGRCVKTFHLTQESGAVRWSESDISSGTYLIRLHNSSLNVTKMVPVL
jgi:hypothetical protein